MSTLEGFLSATRPQLSCGVVDAEAVRYFFNEVPVEVNEALRAHLAGCARCRKKLELFETAWMLDAEKRMVEPNGL
jgi:hypothetical protein